MWGAELDVVEVFASLACDAAWSDGLGPVKRPLLSEEMLLDLIVRSSRFMPLRSRLREAGPFVIAPFPLTPLVKMLESGVSAALPFIPAFCANATQGNAIAAVRTETVKKAGIFDIKPPVRLRKMTVGMFS